MRKPQIKMLKTRAKNARFRANKAKARATAAADHAAKSKISWPPQLAALLF
jgi:hypothetical protein